MSKLTVFNSVSLDGYFTDERADVSWAHRQDPEWNAFVGENAGGTGVLLLGRVTYQMMASHWATEAGRKDNRAVAEGMTKMRKVVFSRTLDEVGWENTTIVKGDILAEVRDMKRHTGPDLVILGSGSIVAQLTRARLIDEYQLVLVPVVLGKGRTMFEEPGARGRTGGPGGSDGALTMKLRKSRPFSNGNVVLWYEPSTAPAAMGHASAGGRP
jgi:dihydrofolate reductase